MTTKRFADSSPRHQKPGLAASPQVAHTQISACLLTIFILKFDAS
jgi:hypothetical protein